MGEPAVTISEARAWLVDAQFAINLVTGTQRLFENEVILDDISLLGQLGNHLIDVVDFVASRVSDPVDARQAIHWPRFLELSRQMGLEVTTAATTTFDLTRVGELAHLVASEIRALTVIAVEDS
ncbi:MAG TPA: hypothetical protein VN886_17935 [Acidimicrobiales bacterium]|nr:hypothetical protein [Acidimicrobiales bacterium]